MPETEICEPFAVSSPRPQLRCAHPPQHIVCWFLFVMLAFTCLCGCGCGSCVCVCLCVRLQIVPDLAYTAVCGYKMCTGMVRTCVLYADNGNNNKNNNTALDQQHHWIVNAKLKSTSAFCLCIFLSSRSSLSLSRSVSGTIHTWFTYKTNQQICIASHQISIWY